MENDSLNIEDLLELVSTNKRVTRVTEPHLRSHKVKGKLYYYYCRGNDPEIYLGSADSILRTKLASGKNRGS